MEQRPLPLDPEQVPPLRTLDHQPLRGAREEVRDHRIDGDPPAGYRDTGLAGGHEHGAKTPPSRLAIELERHRHLSDRAVGADGEHHLRVVLEVAAGGDVQVRRRLA
jgi:hypothetical protein